MVNKSDINYKLELEENVSANDIEKIHQDSVNIWITGSGCGNNEDGKFRYILQYRNTKKFQEQAVTGATANQAYIHGAIHAVRCIKKPCKVCIVIPAALGFEKAFQGKGVNADLIGILYQEIVDRGCELTEVRYINGAESIKKYIAINSNQTRIVEELEQQNREKEDRKLQYKKAIYKECLEKVCETLRKDEIDEVVIEKILNITP